MAGWSRRSTLLLLAAAFLAASSRAYPQTYYQDQQALVRDLPTVVARSHDPADVLSAALQTVFHKKEICCERRSALEDSVAAADPLSLKDVAAKLNGRHLRTDGRPFQVTADFVTPDAATASLVISTLTEQHPLLMEWNSRIYVVYGVEYIQTVDNSAGATTMVIRKFLLWDTRYSDEHRDVIFDRETEDPTKVQGLLIVQWQSD